MSLHDASAPDRPAGGDWLSTAILVATGAALVLGGAAFAALPWLRLSFFQAYEAMYQSMVVMSVICR